MTTPEARIKKVIDVMLEASHAYWHKAIGSMYGKPALDYDVGKSGFHAVIEVKAAPSKHPTPRQTIVMREIVASGSSLFLIDEKRGPDILELAAWLVNPTPGFVSTAAKRWLTRSERQSPPP
jgi:hypothetical protein